MLTFGLVQMLASSVGGDSLSMQVVGIFKGDCADQSSTYSVLLLFPSGNER
jgi:hypothetical protein